MPELKSPKNINYCANVVGITNTYPLPGCDNVIGTKLFGYSVIVGKDTKIGDYGLFFPLETRLSDEFLRHNNLYRDSKLNEDPTKKGYFESHGRIRAVKFRGHISEGFYIPITSLSCFGEGYKDLRYGDVFDEFEGKEICGKYTPAVNPPSIRKSKTAKPKDKILPGQFKFHVDTEQLKRCYNRILPDADVWVTYKYHGTSFVFGNLLVNKKIGFWERLVDTFIPIEKTHYAPVWSSRRVIKGVGEPKSTSKSYYLFDIYTEVAEIIKDRVPKGYTVYGEIVGYAGNTPIQKRYTYGCRKGEWKLYVYRVTYTNPDGVCFELSGRDIVQWCRIHHFTPVETIYTGLWCKVGGDETSGSSSTGEYIDYTGNQQKIGGDKITGSLTTLEYIDKQYVQDKECKYNPGKPHEGVCVRDETFSQSGYVVYKLKNYKFLELETAQLDQGESNIEDAQ